MVDEDPNTRRLDAMIRLLIELNKNRPEGSLTMASTVNILKSCGLKPTEIAHILGKSSVTDIAQYLYQKKERK